jgi:hypothetical protein
MFTIISSLILCVVSEIASAYLATFTQASNTELSREPSPSPPGVAGGDNGASAAAASSADASAPKRKLIRTYIGQYFE